MAAPWLLPGMSLPANFTVCALGARTRKTIFFSAVISGETTTGPCGPRPPRPGCATGWGGCAQTDAAASMAAIAYLMAVYAITMQRRWSGAAGAAEF